MNFFRINKIQTIPQNFLQHESGYAHSRAAFASKTCTNDRIFAEELMEQPGAAYLSPLMHGLRHHVQENGIKRSTQTNNLIWRKHPYISTSAFFKNRKNHLFCLENNFCLLQSFPLSSSTVLLCAIFCRILLLRHLKNFKCF